ncbi:unnamed protein product, partial [Didymodactylos carnosus]
KMSIIILQNLLNYHTDNDLFNIPSLKILVDLIQTSSTVEPVVEHVLFIYTYTNKHVSLSFQTEKSFATLGAAYGTAKSGCDISAMAVMRPEFIMKSVIPVVMAGIIAIYGLVVAVLIANNIQREGYGLFKAFLQLGAGLSVGLSGLGMCTRKQLSKINHL